MAKTPVRNLQPHTDGATGLGGKREKGLRSAGNQQIRANALLAINKSLGIDELKEAFPSGTFPTKEIGDTALSNLKKVAHQVANLDKFQKLIGEKCRDSAGRPVPLGWSHTVAIWTDIKDNPTPSTPSVPIKSRKLPPNGNTAVTSDATSLANASSILDSAVESNAIDNSKAPLRKTPVKPPIGKSKKDEHPSGLVKPSRELSAPFNHKSRKDSLHKAAEKFEASNLEEMDKLFLEVETPRKIDANQLKTVLKRLGSEVNQAGPSKKQKLGNNRTGFSKIHSDKDEDFAPDRTVMSSSLKEVQETPASPAESFESLESGSVEREKDITLETPQSPAESSRPSTHAPETPPAQIFKSKRAELLHDGQIAQAKFDAEQVEFAADYGLKPIPETEIPQGPFKSKLAALHARNQISQAAFDAEHESLKQKRERAKQASASNLFDDSDTIDVQPMIISAANSAGFDGLGTRGKVKVPVKNNRKTETVLTQGPKDGVDVNTVVPMSPRAAASVIKRMHLTRNDQSPPVDGRSLANKSKQHLETSMKLDFSTETKKDMEKSSETAEKLSVDNWSPRHEHEDHTKAPEPVTPSKSGATIKSAARPTKHKPVATSKADKQKTSVKATVSGGNTAAGKTSVKPSEHSTKFTSVSPAKNSTKEHPEIPSKSKGVTAKDGSPIRPKLKGTVVNIPKESPGSSQDPIQGTLNRITPALPLATIRLDSTLTPADFDETHAKGVMATRGNLAMIPNKARRYFSELLGSFPTMKNAMSERDPVEEIVYNKFATLLPVFDELDRDLHLFFRKVQQE